MAQTRRHAAKLWQPSKGLTSGGIMSNELKGQRIAILVADGFEQVEMTGPRKALDDAGAKTEIVSPMQGEVQGWNHHEKGNKFHVDVDLMSADPHQYDALLLPGGV